MDMAIIPDFFFGFSSPTAVPRVRSYPVSMLCRYRSIPRSFSSCVPPSRLMIVGHLRTRVTAMFRGCLVEISADPVEFFTVEGIGTVPERTDGGCKASSLFLCFPCAATRPSLSVRGIYGRGFCHVESIWRFLHSGLNKGLLSNEGSCVPSTAWWVTRLKASTGCSLSHAPGSGYDASFLRHAMQPIEQSSGANEWVGCSFLLAFASQSSALFIG